MPLLNNVRACVWKQVRGPRWSFDFRGHCILVQSEEGKVVIEDYYLFLLFYLLIVLETFLSLIVRDKQQ